MGEKIWYIQRCDLFEQLAAEDLRQLEQRSVIRKFHKGDMIYFPRDTGQSVLLVLKGRVKIKDITPDGKEAIFAFIDEGELFGELSVLDESPRNEYAQAVEATEVLSIPRQEILDLIERHPGLAMHITKLVGLRRRRIENRLRNIMFHSNRERVSSVLMELLESHGERRGSSWEISLRLSHQELASLIGSTRETVTVALGNLQLEGVVRVRRRRITVLDRDKLAAGCNGSL